MELEGVVQNGVIVPDDATALPEGTRVRITPAPAEAPKAETPKTEAPKTEAPKSFGERYAEFRGAIPDLPEDLAAQHEHYRLGTPKR